MKYKGMDALSNATLEQIKAALLSKYQFWDSNQEGIYIFGTGLMGQFVYERCKENSVPILGFIENDKEKLGQYNNTLPVVSVEDVNKNSIIIIATLNYWYEVSEQLKNLEFKKYICYEELAAMNSLYPSYNQSFFDLLEELVRNKDEYLRCFQLLEDEYSKEIFDLVILFRLTFNIKYSNRAFRLSLQSGKQYFDKDIVSPREDEVFVEGGGFDGGTVCDFLEWNNRLYKKIFFFEPDIDMLNSAKQRLREENRIYYINCGLGAKREYLDYSSKNGTGGGGFEIDKIHVCGGGGKNIKLK